MIDHTRTVPPHVTEGAMAAQSQVTLTDASARARAHKPDTGSSAAAERERPASARDGEGMTDDVCVAAPAGGLGAESRREDRSEEWTRC